MIVIPCDFTSYCDYPLTLSGSNAHTQYNSPRIIMCGSNNVSIYIIHPSIIYYL